MCQFKNPAPRRLWYPVGPGPPGSSAESARGISPRAADRSVLDSLPSHGSCHPGELPPSTETSGHLLCQLAHDDLGAEPTPFAPRALPRFLSLLLGSPPLGVVSVLSPSWFQTTCGFSVCIDAQVPTFRTTTSSRLSPPACRM